MLPTSASVERGDGKQTLCRLGTPGCAYPWHGDADRFEAHRSVTVKAQCQRASRT